MEIKTSAGAIVANIGETRRNLEKLIEISRDGGEVLLARRGKPIARLVALEERDLALRPTVSA